MNKERKLERIKARNQERKQTTIIRIITYGALYQAPQISIHDFFIPLIKIIRRRNFDVKLSAPNPHNHLKYKREREKITQTRNRSQE